MKFKFPFCKAGTDSSSSSFSSSPSPSIAASDSDSDSNPPSPRYFDAHGTEISARAYWQYTDLLAVGIEEPTPPSLQQELADAPFWKAFDEAKDRDNARAFAIQSTKDHAKTTFLNLLAEERALAVLRARALKAQDAATTALLPIDEDSIPVSLKWAMKEVKRRLALQEEYDAALALLNTKEMWVRLRRAKMESMKRELIAVGQWKYVERDIVWMIEKDIEAAAEKDAEMEVDVSKDEGMGRMGRWSAGSRLGNAKAGKCPTRKPLPRTVEGEGRPLPMKRGMNSLPSAMPSEQRPPLVRRHATSWVVS